jgi:plasmid stability protein
MTRLSIDLPEDVRRRLEARAARSGHMTVEAYVQALLTAEAEESLDNYAGPPHLTFHTDAELEALLLDRLNDTRPDIEATPEFWEDLERRAEARRRKGA